MMPADLPAEPPPSPIPPPLEPPSLLSDPASLNAPLTSDRTTPAFDPAAQPPPESPSPTEPAAHPILFHGRTHEYFRIWIVNTLFTLLTFGIFFAWAKVRKRRYLRGSTELLGHRFDYQANPVRLLVGHFVVLCLLLGYSLFGVVYPAIRVGVFVIGGLLLPWIVVRSITFNAHNTVYRGLRFRFNRSLSAALKVYLLEPVLIPLSLGFYYPAWQRSKRDYAINNHRLGDAYFRFNAKVGPFYSTYFLSGLILFAAMFLGGVTIYLDRLRHPGAQQGLVELIPFFIVYGLGFFVSRQLVFARLFNHIWNHTRIDEHRFCASLRLGKWLGLQLTNLGAILISAGLLYPWALIRAHHYTASCLHFVPAGPVDSIQRVGGSGGSATGDMAAEFVGLDFGL